MLNILKANLAEGAIMKIIQLIPVIYPDVLRAAHVHKFVLFEGTDIRQSYECKFDEDGKFLGWRKS